MGKKFQNEAYIIHVNGAYRDQSSLGILTNNFSCTDPDDITDEVLDIFAEEIHKRLRNT